MVSSRLINIPASQPFLPALVEGLSAEYGDALPRALILLPTRRSVAALRDAFLAKAPDANTAILIPRIQTLGDIDEEELSLSGDPALSAEIAALPRAISPMRRRFLLMQLILKLYPMRKAEAFQLADDLGGLIDQSIIEGCDLKSLEAVVPENYAAHWQHIRAFLSIVHENWPQILKENNAIDALDRSQRLMRLQNQHWQRATPDFPIIIAGSTGSRPATAELMHTVSQLPKGMVVLPGVDMHLEEAHWDDITETHPQYFMAAFLKRCKATREDIENWGDPVGHDASWLLSEALRPAPVTDRWRYLSRPDQPKAATRHLYMLEAANENQEAMAAALMLRECAENPDCRAALVTPDRKIAARVAAQMRRWGIEVNDSAGVKLSSLPPAVFLLLLLNVADEDVRPSGLMAFFKHPFTGMGRARGDFLTAARNLEHDFFRQHLCGANLRSWQHLPKSGEYALLKEIGAAMQPLHTAAQPIAAWLDALLNVASKCVAQNATLWRGAEGETLAKLIEDMSESADDAPLNYAEFTGLFRYALDTTPVRPLFGQHPRLSILGTIEARLLSFDRLILAGLNEATWPTDAPPDPWMSRAMRRDLGLASPDRSIGQMAHDFVQAAAQPHVTLLRATRAGETPTIPSRWWLRLQAVLEMLGEGASATPPQPWLEWAHAIDQSETLSPIAPPAARIPASAFPATISASDMALWVQDPYAFYAKKVLNLKALNGLDAEFGPRERGSLIHDVIAGLAEKYPTSWPTQAIPDFIAAMEKGLHNFCVPPETRAIMATRIPGLAADYYRFEKERRAVYGQPLVEVKGEWQVAGINIITRADRIDRVGDGIVILDYKTGEAPSPKRVELGLKPQLPIEAVIVEAGGFAALGKKAVQGLAHIEINEGKSEFKYKDAKIDPASIKAVHLPGITNFINAFLADPVFHAAPRPQILPPSPDYARLERVAEWSKGAIMQEEADA